MILLVKDLIQHIARRNVLPKLRNSVNSCDYESAHTIAYILFKLNFEKPLNT